MSDSLPSSSHDPVVEKSDLSRMRHELRTPINHILGYCEMLMEEQQLPPAHLDDLRRIHSGGRELQALITRHFDEGHFFQRRDLHQLFHELRTPVNHIIGYTDLLIEQADSPDCQAAISDLNKIREAAMHWLALMEAYLVDPEINRQRALEEPGFGTNQTLSLNVGLSLRVPKPQSSQSLFRDEGAILIVDDDESSTDMLARRLRRCGYTVSAASGGLGGLALARSQKFDLVLLDMIMPGLDGFQILSKFKLESALRDIPVIMLSGLDEENGIVRCIEMGAEDYLSKPFNPVFLRARIGACLERKRLHDRERAAYEALRQTQQRLASELAEAAAYLRSLLPPPLHGKIETEWCFHPSAELGGDAFGYHWLDDQSLAIYLIDVCGHGIGAALLSVSVLNTLRAHALANVNFRSPAQVLAGLNRAYRMDDHHQLYFTIWYGIYRAKTRQLNYASGGHPPALLLGSKAAGIREPISLTTIAPPIGCMDESIYTEESHTVSPGSRLLVLSDGVYEILRPDQRTETWKDFLASFSSTQVQSLTPAQRLRRAQELHGAELLEDDFSLVEVRFD